MYYRTRFSPFIFFITLPFTRAGRAMIMAVLALVLIGKVFKPAHESRLSASNAGAQVETAAEKREREIKDGADYVMSLGRPTYEKSTALTSEKARMLKEWTAWKHEKLSYDPEKGDLSIEAMKKSLDEVDKGEHQYLTAKLKIEEQIEAAKREERDFYQLHKCALKSRLGNYEGRNVRKICENLLLNVKPAM